MDQEILKNSKTGFEFEFLTELSNHDLVNKLQKLLGKKILIADKYHSDVQVSDKVFKIEPDFSAGMNGRELVTGPLMHEEAKVIFEKVMNFIRRYGKTNEKTAFQPNISFDQSVVKSLQHQFNPIKFIIDLDEDQIYEKFPERQNNLYAKSIKKLKTLDANYVISESNFNPRIIGYPNTKYFGVNFEKLVKDYLEVRYLGGDMYEYKQEDITSVWEYMIEQIFNASNPDTNRFTAENMTYLNEVLNHGKQLQKKLSSAKSIAENYEGIKFTMDLDRNPKVIDNKLYLIKDKMYNLFMNSNLKEGVINYDSERGRFQLKNFKLEHCELDGVDLMGCEIDNSMITGTSELHRSVVRDSDVENSKVMRSQVKNSRIANSFVDRRSEVWESFVKGRTGFFDGHLKSGIFREGYLMHNAKIGKDVDVIEFKKFN